MFDFAWSEIALIAVVALIAIGPKDMPVAIKAVAEVIKKARRMAGEFQSHVDEMVREANLHEVRDQINEIRNFDIKGQVEKAVDADGSLRATFASSPLAQSYTPPPPTSAAPAVETTGEAVSAAHDTGLLERSHDNRNPEPPALAHAPSFIPPEAAHDQSASHQPAPDPAMRRPDAPPAFIPPEAARRS
jgi:sec-independent protein translocase protein TatB